MNRANADWLKILIVIALLVTPVLLSVPLSMSKIFGGPDERRDRLTQQITEAVETERQAREQVERIKEGLVEGLALRAAEQHVKNRLLAPGSARWPSFWDRANNEYAKRISENRYVVESWVDAQNRFGALLRREYTAYLTYNPSTGEWSLDSLYGLE